MIPALEAWHRDRERAARLPIVRDLRQLQAEWDRLAAASAEPMPCGRPGLANLVLGTGLLLAGGIVGTLIVAMLP